MAKGAGDGDSYREDATLTGKTVSAGVEELAKWRWSETCMKEAAELPV